MQSLKLFWLCFLYTGLPTQDETKCDLNLFKLAYLMIWKRKKDVYSVGNSENKENECINSVQSSLMSCPLWVNLYILLVNCFLAENPCINIYNESAGVMNVFVKAL